MASSAPRGVQRSDSDRALKQSVVRIQCGDCSHFRGCAHPSMGAPCHTLGVSESSPAPDCYAPNIAVFRSFPPDAIRTLAAMTAAMSPSQTRVFMGLLRNSASAEKRGFKLLQTVYFTTGQKETLSDFYKGWVFGVSGDGMVTLVGQQYLDSGRSALTAVLHKSSIFTKKQFSAMVAERIRRGLIENPMPDLSPKEAAIAYEPPTLDTAQEFLESKAEETLKGKPKAKRQKSEDGTLFSITQKAYEEN